MKHDPGIKIFSIGFNKCGTTSLHDYFKNNSISSIHWEKGKIAENFARRMSAGEDPFLDYEDIIHFSDMEKTTYEENIEVGKYYEYIHSYYPDSFYVLNTRPRDNWIRSRLNHKDLTARYKSVYNLNSVDAVIEHWRNDWDRHHADVVSFFGKTGGRLLVFDIEEDSVDKLNAFLAPAFPNLNPSKWAQKNNTKDKNRWPKRAKRKIRRLKRSLLPSRKSAS